MCNQCEAALINEIRLYGVAEYRIEQHGSHRTLLFTFRDRPVRLVFGTNPSDRHHKMNALSDLRRAMGVKRLITKRSGARPAVPPPRRSAPVTALPVLTASPRPDPWAVLQTLAPHNPAQPAVAPEPPETRRTRLHCPQFGSRARWQDEP
jgi:hypothetical protein